RTRPPRARPTGCAPSPRRRAAGPRCGTSRGTTRPARARSRPPGAGSRGAASHGRCAVGNVTAVYILIDLNLRDVELEDVDDTRRFHVSVAHGDDYAKVADILSEKDVGDVD